MDEAALIRDAQRGDVDAYNGLVLHYQTQVYNVAYRVMGERDAATDATQEAFIRAYKNLGRFRAGNFKAWLLRIVTNLCYDELRRRKRRPSTSLEAMYGEGPPQDPAFHSQSESPESYAQRMELRQAIEECLRSLSDDHRVVTVLSDVQGFSYDEIAQTANVTLGTVKSRLSRARAQLRDCLRESAELLPASYRLD
jgi:RNA polymerase sigma-70 factor (ECF subfamily)